MFLICNYIIYDKYVYCMEDEFLNEIKKLSEKVLRRIKSLHCIGCGIDISNNFKKKYLSLPICGKCRDKLFDSENDKEN